jgi:hypothetical protein
VVISYSEQSDGSLMSLVDDILITLRPLGGNRYAYEVWIDDEVPAYRGEAEGLEVAKSRVQDWLNEALSSRDPEG